MPINSTNGQPRSLGYLQEILSSHDDRFVLMDIGARDGVMPQWKPIADVARIIGFEPDRDECDRLNGRSTGVEFIPSALAAGPGERPFYLTELEYCYGFMPCDEKYFGRFPNAINNAVRSQITLQADSLDNIVGKSPIPHIDFIKIDTEGSELDVLQGARNTLRNGRVLGLLVEVWWDPRLKNQPAFSDLDAFIRDHGFSFFDIECQRYPRNALPVGRMNKGRGRWFRFFSRFMPDSAALFFSRFTSDAGALSCEVPYRYFGQILTGDALYFRDPVWDLSQGKTDFHWDDETILRLVGLLDLYNYPDFAIEILDFYRDRFTRSIDVDLLIDSLVPPVDGVILPFDEYWDISARLFATHHLAPHIRPKLRLFKPKYRPK
jgi:FkbM family methyltransferase